MNYFRPVFLAVHFEYALVINIYRWGIDDLMFIAV